MAILVINAVTTEKELMISKKRKTISIITGVVIAILTVAYFHFDSLVEKLVREKLTKLINQDPNKAYNYEFESLNINLFTGSLVLRDVGLIPRSAALDNVRQMDGPMRFIMSLKVEKIEMDGFEMRKFLETGFIEVDRFFIRNPEFYLFFNSHKQEVDTRQGELLSEILTKKFNGASLNEFEIKEGTLKIKEISEETKPLEINSFNLLLTEARADSTTLGDFIPFEFKNISFHAASIFSETTEEFSIESDSLFLEAADNTIKIKNFKLRPKFTREAFSQRYNIQKQWFSIDVKELTLEDLNFDDLYLKGEIEVNKINILNPNISLYKDKTKTMPTRRKRLPASFLRSIDLRAEIDTIEISNGLISINEKSPITGQLSDLNFHKLSGSIFNLNTIHDRPDNILKIQARADAMNTAAVTLNVDIDLNSKQDEFHAYGHVDSVEVIVFNPVLVPMMAIEVKGGIIHEVDFEFDGSDSLSVGKLHMEYNNLKFDILNADLEANKKHGFLSFAANTVIKNNNNRANELYNQGIISTTRVQEKDIWPFIWHSVQSGLVSVIAPVALDKDIKKQAKTVNRKHRQNLK